MPTLLLLNLINFEYRRFIFSKKEKSQISATKYYEEEEATIFIKNKYCGPIKINKRLKLWVKEKEIKLV